MYTDILHPVRGLNQRNRNDQIAFVPKWPLIFRRMCLYSLALTVLIQLLKQRSVEPNTSVMLVLSILHLLPSQLVFSHSTNALKWWLEVVALVAEL